MEILMHGHHRGLLSVVTSKEARIADIQKYKPPQQQELRLQLLQAVDVGLLPKAVVKAAKGWDKAVKVRDKAWDKASDKTAKAQDKTDKARVKAWVKAWVKADKAWDKTSSKADKAQDNFLAVCLAHKAELETLHVKLCLSKHPDCPWDGERILPD